MFHRERRKNIELIRQCIDPDGQYNEKTEETVQEIMLRLTGVDITLCPHCQKGRMIPVANIPKVTPVNIDLTGAVMDSA